MTRHPTPQPEGASAEPKPEHNAAAGEPLPVQIRPYTADDEARVKAITIAGFAPVSIDAAIDRRWPGQLPVPWSARKWLMTASDLLAQPEHCFVAVYRGPLETHDPPFGDEAAETVVGFVTTRVDRATGVGRIPDLAVDQRVQGMGIGRRLLEHALARFVAMGLRVARIETLEHNEVGRHLYPSLGFQEVARQVHYAMTLPGSLSAAKLNVPGEAAPVPSDTPGTSGASQASGAATTPKVPEVPEVPEASPKTETGG